MNSRRSETFGTGVPLSARGSGPASTRLRGGGCRARQCRETLLSQAGSSHEQLAGHAFSARPTGSGIQTSHVPAPESEYAFQRASMLYRCATVPECACTALCSGSHRASPGPAEASMPQVVLQAVTPVWQEIYRARPGTPSHLPPPDCCTDLQRRLTQLGMSCIFSEPPSGAGRKGTPKGRPDGGKNDSRGCVRAGHSDRGEQRASPDRTVSRLLMVGFSR